MKTSWRTKLPRTVDERIRNNLFFASQKLALSILAVLAMHPLFATAAGDDPDDALSNEPGSALATAEQSITPERELLSKVDAIESVRIILHSQKPAEKLADQLQSLLTALGASLVETRIVKVVPESNQIRYFHSADREAGQVVGEALSLVFDDVAVRSFENYQPAPADGLIEVWLR